MEVVRSVRAFIGRHRIKLALMAALGYSAWRVYRVIKPHIGTIRMMMKMMNQPGPPQLSATELAELRVEEAAKVARSTAIVSEKQVGKDMAHLKEHLKDATSVRLIEPFRERNDAAKKESKKAQVAIISRYDFRQRQLQMQDEGQDVAKIPQQVKRDFLTLTNVPIRAANSGCEEGETPEKAGFFVSGGLSLLASEVRASVEQVLGQQSVKWKVPKGELPALLTKIRQGVEEGEGASKAGLVRRWMLPPEQEAAPEGTMQVASDAATSKIVSLNDLVDELRDIVDGPDFETVVAERLDSSFAYIQRELYVKTYESKENNEFPDGWPLVKLCPKFKELSDLLCRGQDNTALKEMNALSSNQDFFTCVYNLDDK